MGKEFQCHTRSTRAKVGLWEKAGETRRRVANSPQGVGRGLSLHEGE